MLDEIGKIVEQVTRNVIEQLDADKAGSVASNVQPTGSLSEIKPGAIQLARMIDHTLLRPDATTEMIRKLCDEAKQYQFAAVCVNPVWVKTCAELLAGKGVVVCAAVGFPLGANCSCIKVEEAKRAVSDGAREIDMVMSIGRFLSGDYVFVLNDIKRVVDAVPTAHVKVILETCLLNDEQKVAACVIARQAGAHFVKTSTGFAATGAMVADVVLMRTVVGAEMGVKAAGGIRDYGTAKAMIQAGANRIGTSAGVAIMGGWEK
jgi:deoxyribose-phosphate aldolase